MLLKQSIGGFLGGEGFLKEEPVLGALIMGFDRGNARNLSLCWKIVVTYFFYLVFSNCLGSCCWVM